MSVCLLYINVQYVKVQNGKTEWVGVEDLSINVLSAISKEAFNKGFGGNTKTEDARKLLKAGWKCEEIIRKINSDEIGKGDDGERSV